MGYFASNYHGIHVYIAKKFNGDVSTWDTTQVTDMSSMFEKASSFNQPLTMDTSKVTDMSYMFKGARAMTHRKPVGYESESESESEEADY